MFLNDTILNNKIELFLTKKSKEFPELDLLHSDEDEDSEADEDKRPVMSRKDKSLPKSVHSYSWAR